MQESLKVYKIFLNFLHKHYPIKKQMLYINKQVYK